MPHIGQAILVGYDYLRPDAASQAGRVARGLYQHAFISGWLGKVATALTERPRRLLNLAEIEENCPPSSSFSIGIQIVPIRQIRGSQGRSNDFDGNFFPLRDHLKSRWLHVATAYQLGIILPPVELVQVGSIYFVQDGHHRISVARALGYVEIEARVKVWQIATRR